MCICTVKIIASVHHAETSRRKEIKLGRLSRSARVIYLAVRTTGKVPFILIRTGDVKKKKRKGKTCMNNDADIYIFSFSFFFLLDLFYFISFFLCVFFVSFFLRLFFFISFFDIYCDEISVMISPWMFLNLVLIIP